jgi:release factor glutamine methyltransferase
MTASEAYQKSVSLLIDSGFSLTRARLEARLLLDHVCGVRHAHLLQPDRVLAPRDHEQLLHLCMELRSCQPLAYLTRQREFFGLPFRCDRRALIPRPETEILVELAATRLKNNATALIADLGTGSGCIAVSVAHVVPGSVVYATDLSLGALDLARENAALNHVTNRIEFVAGRTGKWASPLLREGFGGMFDCVLSNPPYISKPVIEALEPQIRDWEPRLALDGGDDGLDCYRQIASQCGALLKADGFLAVELGAGQFDVVRSLFRSEGWNVEPPVHDLAGIERVLVATFNR